MQRDTVSERVKLLTILWDTSGTPDREEEEDAQTAALSLSPSISLSHTHGE